MSCGSPWNSLEVTKLVVDLALPVILLLLGFLVFRVEKKIESGISKIEFGNEWKKSLYDEISLNLNRLLCTFNYVGEWREFSPNEIIEMKRYLDTKIYSYKPLFSDETISNYEELMKVSYKTQRGRDKQILIMANAERYKEEALDWKPEYESSFVAPDQRTKRDKFNQKFDDFQRSLFADMGFTNS